MVRIKGNMSPQIILETGEEKEIADQIARRFRLRVNPDWTISAPTKAVARRVIRTLEEERRPGRHRNLRESAPHM